MHTASLVDHSGLLHESVRRIWDQPATTFTVEFQIPSSEINAVVMVGKGTCGFTKKAYFLRARNIRDEKSVTFHPTTSLVIC